MEPGFAESEWPQGRKQHVTSCVACLADQRGAQAIGKRMADVNCRGWPMICDRRRDRLQRGRGIDDETAASVPALEHIDRLDFFFLGLAVVGLLGRVPLLLYRDLQRQRGQGRQSAAGDDHRRGPRRQESAVRSMHLVNQEEPHELSGLSATRHQPS